MAGTIDLIEKLNPLLVIPGHGKMFTQVPQSIAAARRRLEGFVREPLKHAVHAAKVLLKFKLLELQRARAAEFTAWATGTPYFRLVHGGCASQTELADWVELLVDGLVQGGTARRDGEHILNA